jgi:hypothetical protein
MNVGATTGALSSAAGAPLSQTAGAETERTQKESAARERVVDSQNKSERASGIGETQEDHESSERDADGRRLWEAAAKKKDTADAADPEIERKAKDPTGMTGNELDLTG